MITKFKIYENIYNSDLIKKIQSVLTPDLLKGIWNKESINPLEGHCYIATEALYWMLGGPYSGYIPYVLSHKNWPEVLEKGETHWFLKNKKGNILDPTAGQFENINIEYERGTPNGMMNHPIGGSKRAKEIIRRISMLNEKFTFKNNIKKTVYYTQNFIDKEKVNKLINIVNENWIKNNPVAFEVYKGKLFLTEGHHRFEACLKKNDQKLLKSLFDSALYYNINYEPKSYKKKIIMDLIEKNNIKKLNKLNENLSSDHIKAAMAFIKDIIKDTEWEGKIYVAGGAVRDEIMGIDPKDIDILVNYPDGGIIFAEWITKKLRIYTKGNPIIYPRFGTAKFNLRKQKYNGLDLSEVEVECVMPRKEIYKEGDRNPDVSQGTLKDDVRRRDFTVNSLLKDLSSGEILDLTGMGKDDIKRGIVRTPLDPDVIFSEDPLRMMRCARFSVKYGWDLPMFMIRSMKKNSKKLEYISNERIQDELNKMLISKYPAKAIRLLQMTGLSKYIFPELDKLVKLQQNKYHKFDAMRHTLEVLKNTPPDLITRLAALFHDIGKYKTKSEENGEIHFYDHETMSSNIAKDIMKRLRYPHYIIDQVVICIENHMRTKQMGDEVLTSDKVLRKLKMDLGDNLDRVLDLIHADNLSHSDEYNMPNQISNLRKRFKELEEKDKEVPAKPPLSGDDVMDILGISKGPMVGRVLRALTDVYLERPGLSRDELVQIVKNIYSNLV